MKIKFKRYHRGFCSEDGQIFLCQEGLEKVGLLKDFWSEEFTLEVTDERPGDYWQCVVLRERWNAAEGFYFKVEGTSYELDSREYYAVRKLFPYKDVLVLWIRII